MDKTRYKKPFRSHIVEFLNANLAKKSRLSFTMRKKRPPIGDLFSLITLLNELYWFKASFKAVKHKATFSLLAVCPIKPIRHALPENAPKPAPISRL